MSATTSNSVAPIGAPPIPAFDARIINLGIELEQGITTFNDLFISAKGSLFGNGSLSECEVIIYNLTREQQNYLITQTSPFNNNRTAKLLTLDVGRQSYGTFRLYQGNVIAAGLSQPPDIGIVLRGLTGAFLLGNTVGVNQPALSKLSSVAQSVAQSTGTTLNFQATDKNINNYSYSGGLFGQIDDLAECGDYDVFCDNDTLVVKDKGKPLPGASIAINSGTGMVGIPEVNEFGINVKVMINPAIKLGGSITVNSALNPAANGTFTVYKIDFEVANRETPFWYNVWASNYILS